MEHQPDGLLPLFRTHRSFVLTTHVNPDGDAIGSEMALAGWLLSAGKSVSIINHSATPEVYRFLDPGAMIRQFDDARDAGTIADAEVIVVLDANQPERLRSMQARVLQSKARKVCIDHHLEPHPFADDYLIDDDATSTGEILYRLLSKLNGGRLPARVAEALYCAIMTDSGSFRFPRVDAEVHRIVADLIECGADPVRIYSEVFERWSGGRIHLLGEMLAGLKTEARGRLAYVSITREMLERTGTNEDDTDNFTVYPMSVRGVQAGILFLELDHAVKISFRSKGELPINMLAKQFGGNGHKNAAGAHVEGMPFQQVVSRVLAAAVEFMDSTRE